MEQPLSERRQLLQTKIFGHPSVTDFNAYSRAVLSKLSRCHTAGIGVHHYRCSNASCSHLHYQYHSCGNRHCPGCGGIDSTGKWVKEKRSNGRFLFPRRSMEKIYKGYFLEHLRKYIANKSLVFKDTEELENILSVVGQKKWNVYAKAPFGGPAQIIEYLGRYTHKVAITAHRILHIDDSHISFEYKDYAGGNKQKVMSLSHAEFLRRFEQHNLSRSFRDPAQRICKDPSWGIPFRRTPLEHAKNKMERIAAVCRQLKLPVPMQRVHTPVALQLLLQTGQDIALCPVCGKGRMELVKTFIYHNGCLIDAAQLRNRGSPKIKRNYTQGKKLTPALIYIFLKTEIVFG